MAEIDVERKDKKKKNNWWIWTIVVIIAIIVLWLTLDNRTNLQRESEPVINDTNMQIEEPE